MIYFLTKQIMHVRKVQIDQTKYYNIRLNDTNTAETRFNKLDGFFRILLAKTFSFQLKNLFFFTVRNAWK